MLEVEEVERIAHLARLALTQDETVALAEDLGRILAYFDKLGELDTEGVEPMTHAVPLTLRLRDDDIEPSLSVEAATGGAADRDDGSFRVPKIIEGAG